MHKTFFRKALILMLLPVLFACTLPPGFLESVPLATLSTEQVAGTVNAVVALTSTRAAQLTPATPTQRESATPTLSPTVTLSPTISMTPSPSLPPTETLTATSNVPVVNVSLDTNCRAGPGKVYDYRGALLVTQTAEVLAREPTGNYWYIPNPDDPDEKCWIWGNYATVVGNTLGLPIYTPPPTPTPPPSFSLAFDSLESCVGWFPSLKIVNTGIVTFQSAYVKVKDKATSITTDHSTNGFDKVSDCTTELLIVTLGPEATGYGQGYSFAYDPTGHDMTATVKLCTELNLGGICATKTLDFTP